jgi:hypothetical protein
MEKAKPKIFFSYAHEDIVMAKKLYNDIKPYGPDIWFDIESLLPGQDWEVEIEKAIENSNYFIALLSSNSVDKVGVVQSELKKALEKLDKYPEGKIYLLPIRINECNPSYRRIKKIHWINLFPDSQYQNGLKKILQVISPETFFIRNEPKQLSSVDVNEMLKVHGFYDQNRNPQGKGVNHQYELFEIEGDKIIIDKTTNLIWQQSGSNNYIGFKDVENWIKELNKKGYAVCKDWRVPTLEEAMSLMEAKPKNHDLYIDPVFDKKQAFIWTADLSQYSLQAWIVGFIFGFCSLNDITSNGYVRAVRSGQSSHE